MENTNLETTEAQEISKIEPFKVFENQSDFDSFITKTLKTREENIRAKLEPEIKSKLEKEAELTAEQKLNERIKELENEKKAVLVDKNRTKAEREFISKGLNQGSYNEILDFVVSENEEISIQKTRKLIDFIEINSKNIADEKIRKAMKDVAKPENSETKDQNSNESIAQKLGKSASETHRIANETLQKYL